MTSESNYSEMEFLIDRGEYVFEEENEMTDEQIRVMVQAVARVVDGEGAGWGIWADLLRGALVQHEQHKEAE